MNSEIFSSPDIYQPEGPPPVAQPFFEDGRGFIQRIDHDGNKVNLIFTKEGFKRSGDLHNNVQYDFVFSGKVEVWLRVNEEDVKTVYEKNSLIEIPAGTPHLFCFLEDTFLSEWWDGETETWYYRPYRNIIENKE